MATTNLTSKSLGDILLQSGNGTPNHTSTRGSIYVDQDTGISYQNKDGVVNWLAFDSVAYGDASYQGNATASTITAQAVPGVSENWYSVANTFTLGQSVGFTVSTNTLVVQTGYTGKYEVRGDVTVSYVAGTNNYEVGLSINGANPINGTYNGTLIDGTYQRQHIGFDAVISLTASNTIQLAVINLTSTDNFIIRHSQIYTIKVG